MVPTSWSMAAAPETFKSMRYLSNLFLILFFLLCLPGQSQNHGTANKHYLLIRENEVIIIQKADNAQFHFAHAPYLDTVFSVRGSKYRLRNWPRMQVDSQTLGNISGHYKTFKLDDIDDSLNRGKRVLAYEAINKDTSTCLQHNSIYNETYSGRYYHIGFTDASQILLSTTDSIFSSSKPEPRLFEIQLFPGIRFRYAYIVTPLNLIHDPGGDTEIVQIDVLHTPWWIVMTKEQ
jgi:hypothetical protein